MTPGINGPTSLASIRNADVPMSFLPPGFLAIDLANALDLPLWDPDQGNAAVNAGAHTKLSNGVIGKDPQKPAVVVAANGGSDLVYLPPPVDRKLAAILQLSVPNHGKLVGRIAKEAMAGGKEPAHTAKTLRSPPNADGYRTILRYQEVGTTRYFDAAGFTGRTVGLE